MAVNKLEKIHLYRSHFIEVSRYQLGPLNGSFPFIRVYGKYFWSQLITIFRQYSQYHERVISRDSRFMTRREICQISYMLMRSFLCSSCCGPEFRKGQLNSQDKKKCWNGLPNSINENQNRETETIWYKVIFGIQLDGWSTYTRLQHSETTRFLKPSVNWTKIKDSIYIERVYLDIV